MSRLGALAMFTTLILGLTGLLWIDSLGQPRDSSGDPVVDLVGVMERPASTDFGWSYFVSAPSPASWHVAAGVTIGRDSYFYATRQRCEASRMLSQEANAMRPWITVGACRWRDFRR